MTWAEGRAPRDTVPEIAPVRVQRCAGMRPLTAVCLLILTTTSTGIPDGWQRVLAEYMQRRYSWSPAPPFSLGSQTFSSEETVQILPHVNCYINSFFIAKAKKLNQFMQVAMFEKLPTKSILSVLEIS
jgi:hypothetical protein